MKDIRYPQNPPSSAGSKLSLKLRTVTSYEGAIIRGNPLLYLPRHVRDLIYVLLLSSEPQFTNIEIPDTGVVYLPGICRVDYILGLEVTELLLRNTIFTIPSEAAVFKLFVWLNDVDGGRRYAMIANLELIGLDMFEQGVFSTKVNKLLRRCPNVREVRLMIDFEDVIFESEWKCRAMALDVMMRKYDLECLTTLPHLQRIILTLAPSMALGKKLRKMEQERKHGDVGLHGFWGLKEWLVGECANIATKVETEWPDI